MEAHLELESMGILRQTLPPDSLKWMSDDDKLLMLLVFLAGNLGLHKREVAKSCGAPEQATLNLEVRSLAQWERDKNGRLLFLTCTWQGGETGELLLKIAQNQSKKPAWKPSASARCLNDFTEQTLSEEG
jgi:hypothetical protein